MFHSAALKLTLWYLGIIMLLSIGFSLVVYNIVSNDLEGNAQRQIAFFNQTLTPLDFGSYSLLRQQQLSDDRTHLKQNLLFFNVGVLGLGGAASYFMARRTLRPIEEALDSQTRFTADASHELRTPLAAMQTEIEVALRGRSRLSKNQLLEILDSNLEEVAKLKALSDGLLRLAQQNVQPAEGVNASLKAVIKEATERLTKAASVKSVKITNTTKDTLLKGDHQSLVELFAILIDNAIKYSPRGSRVRLTSRRRGKATYISVSDSGQGIETADLPHIFERFYRSDSSRSKQMTEGYGLGLALAKKIADLHHGVIEVKSAPGRGSTFTVRLPAV